MKGGRTVAILGRGHRDRPAATKKKNSYSRDDRLARGGARSAGDVSSFQAPGLPASVLDPFRVSVTPNAAATASPYPAAAAVSAAAVSAAIGSANVAASAADSDDSSNDSSYCEAIDERPAGNKGKIPFVCLPGNVRNLLSDKLNTKCSKVNPNSSST